MKAIGIDMKRTTIIAGATLAIILMGAASWFAMRDGDVQYDLNICANYFPLSDSFSLSEWQHFVFVRNFGSNVTVYKDGVLVGTQNVCHSSLLDNAQDFRIGSTGQPYTGYFDGLIDEIKIYNTSIDPSSIFSINKKIELIVDVE